MRKSSHEVANTGPADRGSELIEKTNCDENASQPHGKSIGAGGAPTAKMQHGGDPHIFRFPKTEAQGFSHQVKSGPYRLSGQKDAHMVGSRKK